MSRFRHCGRMAMYRGSQNIGVRKIISNADRNWNQKDELRALESLITRIRVTNRKKNRIIVNRNRIEFCKISLKNANSNTHKIYQINRL